MLQIIPITGLPEISAGDDLAAMIVSACAQNDHIATIANGDVIIVSQKVVSKSEGRLVDVDPTDPTSHKPLVLAEAKRVLRQRGDLLITETKHGFVCANSGVDRSNLAADKAALLPLDPDRSARRIRARINNASSVDVAVIITDTFGRPWRQGLTDIAIGCAGIKPILDLRGTEDHTGQQLQVTQVCIVDELAAAGELVRGKSDGVAVALVRGGDPAWFGTGSVSQAVIRRPSDDLFR